MFSSNFFKLKYPIAIVLLVSVPLMMGAQELKLNNLKSSLSIFGTSSLHDWEEEATVLKGLIVVTDSEKFQIEKLHLEVPSESLKSGKNAMDKNTYKALKTDKFKNISFNFIRTLESYPLNTNSQKSKILGDLTVAGVTKSIQADVKLQWVENGLNLSGEFDLEMTDYDIDPPKALLGTITTGNKINIKYNLVMN